MSTSTIRTAISAIGDYYKTPETKSRAENLVNNLTSSEREVILGIIKESNSPIPTPNKLSKKLQEIHIQDDNGKFLPLTCKDDGLSSLQLILMNIWRAIKDIFSFRISDKKLLKKIESYAERTDKMSDARADIPELFFTSSDCLEMQLAIAKKTADFDKEIVPASEYQTLGMVGTNFSLEEIESGYRTILKKHPKDQIRLAAAKKAFQTAYTLELVKGELISDQTKPLTLRTASECYRTFSESQKKKLTFLIKFDTYNSLFDAVQDTK